MSQYTDDELRQAAEEVGISPGELAGELRRRGELATRPEQRALERRAPSGMVLAQAQATLPLPPDQARNTVAHSIERQSGKHGHRQGNGELHIVDDTRGVRYRVHASPAGEGHSLAVVEMDASPARGTQAMLATTTAMLAVPTLALGVFFPIMAWVGVLGAFAGVAAVLAAGRRASAALQDADAVARAALLESDDQARLALGSGRTSDAADR